MSTVMESDILFGEFAPERLFIIENSEVQKKAGKGIKTVEFKRCGNGLVPPVLPVVLIDEEK